MLVFSLDREQQWNPRHHVEKILGTVADGDVTVACWEPGQVSPYHCHPQATEIYFCFCGGGTMHTPKETVVVEPGAFVVHPPGEVHEYENGPARTLLLIIDASKTGDEWLSMVNGVAAADLARLLGAGLIAQAGGAAPAAAADGRLRARAGGALLPRAARDLGPPHLPRDAGYPASGRARGRG